MTTAPPTVSPTGSTATAVRMTGTDMTRRPTPSLASRRPTGECVRQQQQDDGGGEPLPLDASHERRHLDGTDRPERKSDHQQRMNPPPRQQARHRGSRPVRHRATTSWSRASVSIVVAPTTAATSNQSRPSRSGRIGRPWFRPVRTARVQDHGASVRNPSVERIGRKNDPRPADRTVRKWPDSRCAAAADREDGVHQRAGMDTQIMITVSGLTKHYGDRIAVDDMSFDVRGRTGHRIRRPERRRQVDDDADDGRPGRVPTAATSYHGVPYTSLVRPARIVGSVLDARCMHPGRTARNHLRATAALSAISTRSLTRSSTRSASRAQRTNVPAASRSACANASPWPAPCWGSPRCCCSTNRPTASTPMAFAGCGTR